MVVFDPLDGSSNLDAGISTGSIFGIYAPSEECSIEDMDNPEKMMQVSSEATACHLLCLPLTRRPACSSCMGRPFTYTPIHLPVLPLASISPCAQGRITLASALPGERLIAFDSACMIQNWVNTVQ